MKKIRKSNIAGEILFLLGIIILWQIFYVAGVDGLGIWKAYAMPSPVGVWNSFVEMMKQGTLLAAIGNSILRGAIGYILSLIIGAVIGILINHFSFLHRNLRPLIMGIQTLPSICWVPFSILWFGLTQIYWKVIFPASLPELISGMKQGWSFAWRALMSGEVMTTSIGLGQTLMTGRNLADINQVMLVMVVIVVVGILIDQVVFYNVEKRVLKKRGL